MFLNHFGYKFANPSIKLDNGCMKFKNLILTTALLSLGGCSMFFNKNKSEKKEVTTELTKQAKKTSDDVFKSGKDVKKNYDSKIKTLSPMQFKVTQKDGTEPPFKNEYWDNKEEGIYVDVVSGEPLFSSKEKYKSGTGWPSFYKPLEEKNIVEKADFSLLGKRIEIRSKNADSHLGHVFTDGPKPSGLRYCMNSASLRFIPKDKLKEEGYEQYQDLFAKTKKKTEYIIVAGGGFWGMEDLIKKEAGVIETVVGYTGGNVPNANYQVVKTGTSGHAESVKITYDPSKTDLSKILLFFFKIHDPTTKNQQGNDIGTQYRSTIFAKNEDQKRIANEVIKKVEALKRFKDPIVTTIEEESEFYTAEDYHQDYLTKNPKGYTCHFIRD